MALVADVRHLQEEGDPADLRLGEVDLQVWEAVEDAVEDHLHGVQPAQAGEARDLAG